MVLSGEPAMDLHCAECRKPIEEFIGEVGYPGCQHLFCSQCFQKHFTPHLGQFDCPLDQTKSQPRSQYYDGFYQLLVYWWNCATMMTSDPHNCVLRDYLNQAFEEVSKWVNFGLFPCRFGSRHPGLERCPYDHSMYFSLQMNLVQAWYCRLCRIWCKTEQCPRCEHRCVLLEKKPTSAIKHTKVLSAAELPYLKQLR